MLKGLALTPPILGRISIGKVVVNDKGTRLPQKDDEFTVTTLAKNKGEWIEHPLDEKLRKAQGPEKKKLHRIPIRLLFNDPDLNFRANYSMFDRETGRPTCVGDGNTCKRSTIDGVVSMPCPTPNQCEASKKSKNGCKPFGRFTARIDMGDEHQDELGSYILRTTGFNSIRTLESRQAYLDAFTGGKLLSCLPLDMVLRAKSTTQSHGAAIYFVDLTIRNGMTVAQAVEMAKKIRAEREAIGIDQAALDAAAREGFAHGAFEESEEEGEDIVPEFYPDADAGAGSDDANQEQAQQNQHQPENLKVARRPQHQEQVAQQSQHQKDERPTACAVISEGQVKYLLNKATASQANMEAVLANLGIAPLKAGVTTIEEFNKIKTSLS